MKWLRPRAAAQPDAAPTTTLNVPCPQCGSTIPLSVEHGPHFVVLGPIRGVCIQIDPTDIEAHLLTHRTPTHP